MTTTTEPTFLKRLDGCTIGADPIYNGEERIGRFSLTHVANGVYELLATCRANFGGTCTRSWGLYRLDDVPECYYNDPMRKAAGYSRRK